MAVASANQFYGVTPLTVQFGGSGSSDPDGNPITYSWNFGDGSAVSTLANPSHTFSAAAGVPTKFTVTLTVTDSGSLSAQTSLIISLNNTPPSVSISSPVDGTLYSPNDTTPISLAAAVNDAESIDSQLSYQWQVLLHHNDHNHIVATDLNPTSTASLGGTGCDGINIYYYRIVLTVSDPAGLSTTREVRMFPDCGSNLPATVSSISDQTINQNTSTGPIAFTVADVEVSAANLQLSASSSNPTLVPISAIVFGGSGSNRTVTATPALGQLGTATVTVTVNDGPNDSTSSFLLTVNGVNNPPLISTIPNQFTGIGVPAGPISFNIGDADSPPNSLNLSGESSNPTLVPNANIVFGGSGSNRTVTLTPVSGQTGTSAITLTVSDGALSASSSFNLTVSTQAPPNFALVAAYNFNEGSGTVLNDLSGKGNNGTIIGGVWTTGKYGGSLRFNGSTAYVDLGNPTSLQITGSISWSAWINAVANPADDGQIIAKSDGTAGWQFKTSPDTGPQTFGASVSGAVGSSAQRYSTTVRSLGTWYHRPACMMPQPRH